MTALLVLALLMACSTPSAYTTETEQLVDRARITFQSMLKDNQYPGLVDLSSRAKAIIIVPSQLRAAFFVGGSGGNAVMLVRDQQNQWSPPAFYTLGGLSFGLQIGGSASEIVIAVMTQKGLEAIMDRRVTLGGDAGIAIGEIGKGLNASTAIGLNADMYAFARSEGLFAGISLEGSVIAPRHSWNQQFYGASVEPRDILINRTVRTNNLAAIALIKAMP